MQKNIKIILLVLVDIILFNISYFLAYLLRFEFDIASEGFQRYFPAYLNNILFIMILKLIIYFLMGMYTSLWRYASVNDLLKILRASFFASLLSIAFLILIQQQPAMPRSIYVLSFMFDVALTGSIRFSLRFLRGKGSRGTKAERLALRQTEKKTPYHIMLIGAGDAGATIIREIRNDRSQNRKIKVVIDDNPTKKGQRFLGIRILGNQGDIAQIAEKYDIDEIIIAIPSASKKQISTIVAECNKTNCKVRILPSIMDLLDGNVSIRDLRDVNIEDLLGREPIQLNLEEISAYIEGRIILVTGGGGSIGSELCRQIATFRPGILIAVDIYENCVFELEGELALRYPELAFNTVIASVCDERRMRQVFHKYKPHIVFHAAAHKHVPLMENNPAEAVENNILGTKYLVDLADAYSVEKFVMISTDKAVNPTNVMGSTKRLSEMIVQIKGQLSSTAFAVVRFGNVLGSNGSVIPIFQKQLEMGGPLTVTDEDITRYFMTIPEATQLVLQSSAMAGGGEVFILDMGEPVRILDLAENLIRLSGLIPYEDIEIVITGLRPGEKMHEELSYKNEFLQRTAHEKIFLGIATEPSPLLAKTLTEDPRRLETMIREDVSSMSDAQVKTWIKDFLPTYQENTSV